MTSMAKTTENARIQQEMRQVRTELKAALEDLHHEVGAKLKPHEKAEI